MVKSSEKTNENTYGQNISLLEASHSNISHLSQVYGTPHTILWVKLYWSLIAQ